jgi:DNA-damage-inducible protein J
MAKSSVMTVRVSPEIKKSAEAVYAKYGLSLSEAVTIFLHKSILDDGLPFDLREDHIPTATKKAMKQTEEIINGTSSAKAFHSAKELFSDLNKE